MWTCTDLLRAVPVAAVLLLGQGSWDWWDLPVWALVLAGVALLAFVVVVPQWRYAVHRWEVTETAVYTQTGWLDQERRIAPVSRIQTVDMARGPVAQALGLASVTVTTASAAGPLKIHGLDLDVARHLVEDLTALTIAERGDAT
jgi:membrane protein YdbS with pleckstrin-like domain